MDRIIEVKVNGNYIWKDNKVGGVQHEYNMTALRIEFDAGWDAFAKKITWWDACGENPVDITLTTNLLEDAAASTRIYLVKIPGEPLKESGWCTFVIDGYIDGKRQRTVQDELQVQEAAYTEEAGVPDDPTPTQAEQLQKQIDSIMEYIHKAAVGSQYADQAANSAQAAAKSAEEANKSALTSTSAAEYASDFAIQAKCSKDAAKTSEISAKNSEKAAKESENAAKASYEMLNRKLWFGTIEEYNALETIEPDICYHILEGDVPV